MATMVAITGNFGDIGGLPPGGGFYEQPSASAVGSINFDAATRTLKIQGSDAHDDRVNVFINHPSIGGPANLPDRLTVTLVNINSPLSYAFDPAAVDKIMFEGLGGNDYLDNRTSIPLVANGGAGNDALLGGSADDYLVGGPGDDYLDGRLGGDMLYGQAGVDALFGDEGIDSLFAGDDVDRLFGGNGNDSLYGEAGNDKLYGGAGTDKLVGGAGTNTLYNDYGPNVYVSASGFVGFDWFDKNLKDPAIRSQVREEYRDGVLNRADMMNVFKTVAIDGVEAPRTFNGTVTTTEFSDLKTIANSKLNFQVDTQFFTQRIVLGDPANAHFQRQTLGNLAANVSGDHLTKLVDKWFRGMDLPVHPDTVSSARYEAVQGSLFVGGPSYEDLDQAENMDNCYFLAALGVVAKNSPSTIQNMFGDNGDGTWSVRFFRNGAPVYVTVNRMLPVIGLLNPVTGFRPQTPSAAGFGDHFDERINLMVRNDGADPANELWVALAEKAYVQLNESGGIGQDGTNSYHGIDKGFTQDVMTQLTGQSVSVTTLPNGSSFPALISAVQAGNAVTLSTSGAPADVRLTKDHTYIVLGYNSATQTFTLFNPHGAVNTDGPDDNSQSPLVDVALGDLLGNFKRWTSAVL